MNQILIIEDDHEISRLLAGFLTENDYSVTCHYDGRNVMDVLEKMR